MDQLKENVSKNIIYLRASRKWTQLQLGEALSYSDKAVSKWERGEAVPDAYVLKKLSDIFGVSVDYLLTAHTPKEHKKTVKSNPLIRLFSRLFSTFINLNGRNTISLISFLGTWTVGILIFVIMWLVGNFFWLTLVYTLPVSLVVMIILTAIIGRRKTNVWFISLLIWSSIATIYLTFLSYNWWFLFFIGIPAQIIVILSFRLAKRKAPPRY